MNIISVNGLSDGFEVFMLVRNFTAKFCINFVEVFSPYSNRFRPQVDCFKNVASMLNGILLVRASLLSHLMLLTSKA